MSRKYYSLIEKLPGESWAVQFGDYSKSVVTQEVADMKDSGTFVKGTKFKVITTDGKQASIDAAVKELNNGE